MQRYQETGRALGSEVMLTIVTTQAADAKQLLAGLWQRIHDFENRFSRFLPDSELSQLNRQAGQRCQASPEMTAILDKARQMANQTNGLYNPLILPALQQAGYVGSWPQPTAGQPGLDYRDRHVEAGSAISVGDSWVELPAGSAVDLGGIGKGYLLDQLAGYLESQGCSDYWLSLGGDIICCGSDPAAPAAGKQAAGWQIGIAKASGDGLAGTATSNGKRLAIATSGTTKRRGKDGGLDWHHIIDPRSGRPAETDIATATVCGPQATIADIYAKCLVIVGQDKAADFIADSDACHFLIQTTDGTVYRKGIVWA